MTQIEIFKAGVQTSNSGHTTDFTADTLRAAAVSYNAKVAEGGDTFKAPLVIGHPTHDAPAYGWVEKLVYNEDTGTLLAEPGSVDEGLKTLVNDGKYKKVSASFYTPDSASNPAKEGFFLRHLGFLGAMAPAVKGLKAVSFSDANDGIVSFGDYDDVQQAGLMRSLRDWILGKFGQDEADKALPGYTVLSLEVAAALPETACDVMPAFSEAAPAEVAIQVAVVAELAAALAAEAVVPAAEPVAEPAVAPAADFAEAAGTVDTPVVQVAAVAVQAATLAAPTFDFAEKEAQIAAREAELAEREQVLRDAEIENFCEGLIADGRVVPGLKNTVSTLFKTLRHVGSIDFAEGEQKPAAELLKDLLTALPKAVHYGEVATDVSGPAPAHMDFTVAPGYTVSTEGLAQLQKAQAYMAAHPECSLIQACSKI
ncbi:MAG: hypothetical protein M3Y65_24905 [Pseudomonadota bacterium]|nr:hypothetical protein [Pseudomonadota bacterium]